MQNFVAYDLLDRLRRFFLHFYSGPKTVPQNVKTSPATLASDRAAAMAEAEETPILDTLDPTEPGAPGQVHRFSVTQPALSRVGYPLEQSCAVDATLGQLPLEQDRWGAGGSR